MLERTRRLWEQQLGSVGDRRGLFGAVAAAVAAQRILYPGSYVDLTPSCIWPQVTYVDTDRRANQFFGDQDGVTELLAGIGTASEQPEVRFVHADYTSDLPLDEESFDLMISLYAGFVSEHCTEHLRIGGFLLVNPSHGDASMASIDPRYRLHAAVLDDDGRHVVETDALDTHLVPKRDVDVTVELLHETGRAVESTRPSFAYLFERVR